MEQQIIHAALHALSLQMLAPNVVTLPPGSSPAHLFQEALPVMCVSTCEAGMISGALGGGTFPPHRGTGQLSTQMALSGQSSGPPGLSFPSSRRGARADYPSGRPGPHLL